ncbi:MAG TPA: tyrosine-type recombinase/integrase [Streptosporangiaceae bacterium]|nr:tyrosine-type recombinase/integrase [Streptosporangiaceae bacterium]
MRTVERPLPTRLDARRVLAETRRDPLLYTSVSLLLFTGVRAGEVTSLAVGDYAPGSRRLAVGGVRYPRTITIAPTAAGALDGYLGGEETAPDEPLLLGMRRGWLYPLLKEAADRAGVTAGMHDLRRAAIAAVIEAGRPADEVQAYFGLSVPLAANALTALPAGWDAQVASSLETAFATAT